MRDDRGEWRPKLKLSEQAAKTTIPGVLQVRRYRNGDKLAGDMIYDETRGIDAREIIVDAKDGNRRKQMPPGAVGDDLLAPVMRGGELTGAFAEGAETLEVARTRATQGLADLDPSVRRLLNPHEHPVGIDVGLHERRDQMIREVRWDFAEHA